MATTPSSHGPAVTVYFTTSTQHTSIERLLELLFGEAK